MRLWDILLKERCPKCKKVLNTRKSNALSATVIKSCPDNHYQKEFHPALETFVESDKVS
ncbi:hypothetical protein H7K20_27935 [Priestia aryabhattai]|uniref:Uncharacterized protein n=1 Tax=Priestia aryabhattai TaxID=412384 RepID=A0ABD7X0I7_PRIAR|nr:hypothetical protein [Priestia aryabhattai]MBY0030887.1 hypothetical protein [Priestia aryabhattai]WEA46151.1 hypothetical protein PWO00_09355 [Priestia aryabhattai]